MRRFHELIVCFLSRRELGTPLFTRHLSAVFSFDILASKVRNLPGANLDWSMCFRGYG